MFCIPWIFYHFGWRMKISRGIKYQISCTPEIPNKFSHQYPFPVFGASNSYFVSMSISTNVNNGTIPISWITYWLRISDSYSSHYISSQLNVLIMEPFPLLYSKLKFANHRLYYWRLKKKLCLKSWSLKPTGYNWLRGEKPMHSSLTLFKKGFNPNQCICNDASKIPLISI